MGRSLSVSLLPKLLPKNADLKQTCSIVIDVLRATSVMATAGQSGVKRMITCGDIDDAFQLVTRSPVRPLLCGERHCKPIDGFDLGNSPAEYVHDIVKGRDMILTTTNGTQAINAVIDSRRLLVSSFLNLDATLTAIEKEPTVQLVCAGTNGEISLEDVLLAGAIVDRLDATGPSDRIDDSARIAWYAWKQANVGKRPLQTTLRHSLGGRNLVGVGFAEDIDRCARINTIDGIVERSEGIAERSDGNAAVFEYKPLQRTAERKFQCK